MQLVILIHDSEAKTRHDSASQAANSKTLLATVEERILSGTMLYGAQQLILIMSHDLLSIHKENLTGLKQNISFILGSFHRNSTAIIAASALHIAQFHSDDTLILVLPSNLLNIPQDNFQQTISIAAELALSGNLVTFGQLSYESNTKYNPLKEHQIKLECGKKSYFQLKGDIRTVNKFLWNSNLFLFKAGTILEAIKIHCPNVLSALSHRLQHFIPSNENNTLLIDLYSPLFRSVPEYSINDEVIKKSNKTVVLSSGFEWLDPNMLTTTI